ncbi:MAG TPA: hypothetical protein VH681_14710, partial [Nitrospiraceae bacterium]
QRPSDNHMAGVVKPHLFDGWTRQIRLNLYNTRNFLGHYHSHSIHVVVFSIFLAQQFTLNRKAAVWLLCRQPRVQIVCLERRPVLAVKTPG